MSSISESSTISTLIANAGFVNPPGVSVEFFTIAATSTNKNNRIVIKLPMPGDISGALGEDDGDDEAPLADGVIVLLAPDLDKAIAAEAARIALDHAVSVCLYTVQAVDATHIYAIGFDEETVEDETDAETIITASDASGLRATLTAWFAGATHRDA